MKHDCIEGQWGFASLMSVGMELSMVRLNSIDDRNYPFAVSIGCSASDNFTAEAIVRWGSSGGQNEARVDIGKGASFHVLGSYIEVIARVTSTGAPTGTVSASCAAGAIQRTTPLTLTQGPTAIGAGAAADFALPAFSKEVTIYRQLFSEAMEISFRRAAGTLIYQRDYAAAAAPETLIVPSAADIIRIENTGLANEFVLLHNISL